MRLACLRQDQSLVRCRKVCTMNHVLPSALAGALSGAAATASMTAFMEWANRRRVESPSSDLPPRQITEEALESTGVENPSEEVVQPATLVAHYSYGAAMGAMFGLLNSGQRMNSCSGTAFGVAVWSASYFGLLPALGSRARGTKQTFQQNATMFAAHLIWGASLALAYESAISEHSRLRTSRA